MRKVNNARDDAGFDAYRIRITDGDGDTVPEGDDVATVAAADVDRTRGSSTFKYNLTQIIVGRIVATEVDQTPFSNVRINDNGRIQAAIHSGGPRPSGLFARPVGVPPTILAANPVNFIETGFYFTNDIYVDYPDEFRDFPTDVLASDETYTLEAWAVNEEGEVISPVQSLRVHPVDTVLRNIIPAGQNFLNYLDAVNAGVTSFHTTEFTVLE